MHKGFRTLLRKCHFGVESFINPEFGEPFESAGPANLKNLRKFVHNGAQDGAGENHVKYEEWSV